MKQRKRPNQAGGFTPESRSHKARLRYIAIAGRRREGASVAEVAAEFDVCPSVVHKAMSTLGLSDRGRPGKPKPWLRAEQPSERVRQRLVLVAGGMSYRQVALVAGVTHQAVADDVRRWPHTLDAMRLEGNA